jgi:hypothetical protein
MSLSLSKLLAERLDVSIEEARGIVDEMVAELRQEVRSSGSVEWPGLGTFLLREDRIDFEPTESVADAVNLRYSGLEPIVVDAGADVPSWRKNELIRPDSGAPEAPEASDETATGAVVTDEPPHETPELDEVEVADAEVTEEAAQENSPSEALEEQALPAEEEREWLQREGVDEHPLGGFEETKYEEADFELVGPEDPAEEAFELVGPEDPAEEAFETPGEPEATPSSDWDSFFEKRLEQATEEAVVPDPPEERDTPAPPVVAVPGGEDPVPVDEPEQEQDILPPAPPAAVVTYPEAEEKPVGRRRRAAAARQQEEAGRPSRRVAVAVILAAFLITGGLMAWYLLWPIGPTTPTAPGDIPAITEAEMDRPVAPEDTLTAGTLTDEPPVTPPTTPTPADPIMEETAFRGTTPVTPAAGGYTLVVGHAASSGAAESLAATYRERGFRVGVLPGQSGGRRIYRVGVGQFPTLSEAQREYSDLPPNFPPDAWIMRVRASN